MTVRVADTEGPNLLAGGVVTSSRGFIPSHLSNVGVDRTFPDVNRTPLLSDRTRFGLLPLVARLLVTSEFLIAVRGKIFGWSGQAAYMQSKGMTLIIPLLAAALFIEAVGSLCLITGYRARTAAAGMFVYLAIVSVTLHAFWSETGRLAGADETAFFKNLGMMGCLLMISIYGPGRWALGANINYPERGRADR